MDKLGLAQTDPTLPVAAPVEQRRRCKNRAGRKFAFLVLASFILLALQARTVFNGGHKVVSVPMHAQDILAKCRTLHTLPA
jgi:hypothetical protein